MVSTIPPVERAVKLHCSSRGCAIGHRGARDGGCCAHSHTLVAPVSNHLPALSRSSEAHKQRTPQKAIGRTSCEIGGQGGAHRGGWHLDH
eukprot:5847664-Prymnesium_polylepis.1